MRAVLFRGKRHDGIWMYGDLLHSCCNTYTIIQPEMIQRHIVLEETVGQFTGLYDKDGKRIYECDLIEVNGRLFGVVEWHKDGYFFINDTIVGVRSDGGEYSPIGEMVRYFSNHGHDFSVIGNIHDNPELLTNK